ncbi:hypothetical protein LR48_Vigan01g155000 [Vigna angularis]|uniref:Uncharacterized protein n=1 Tax=Phaseolus angularis TaxID=3914 RepID=A0A0L9TPD2_PHAAN|nr:hypothetical protein LR48_Vigan01g155000 [Vigna angularis]
MGSCTNFRRTKRRIWVGHLVRVESLQQDQGEEEELLRLQGDLDLHIWEEIDPKIYKEVFKRILQNARTSNFGESKLDVRSISARPNSGRPISERSSLRSRGDRSEVVMEDGSGRLLLRAGYDDELQVNDISL